VEFERASTTAVGAYKQKCEACSGELYQQPIARAVISETHKPWIHASLKCASIMGERYSSQLWSDATRKSECEEAARKGASMRYVGGGRGKDWVHTL
jgi:hypothetical protein